MVEVITGQQVNTLLSYANTIVPEGGESRLRLLTLAACSDARALKVDRGLFVDGVDNIYGELLDDLKGRN